MAHDIKKEYFEWLMDYICQGKYLSRRDKYQDLLEYMFDYPFKWILQMDKNRYEDGLDLRESFLDEYNTDDMTYISEDIPCSILEMMIALSIRIEENIMGDDDLGDRTGKWFWEMIESLGLISMIHGNFDETYIWEVLDDFNNREYAPDGRGGLFTIKNCDVDLRDVEIWYQMNWHLNDISEDY